MVELVDNESGRYIRAINLNVTAAPQTGDYIFLNGARYLVVMRTYRFSTLGNIEDVELRVNRIE